MAEKSRYCDWCSSKYSYERSTSKFCGPGCRVMYHHHGERMMQLLTQASDLFDTMINHITRNSDTLTHGKYLEATAQLVIMSSNLDQHLLKATAKRMSQKILTDYHK